MTTSKPLIEATLLRLLEEREGKPFKRQELLEAYRSLSLEHGRSTAASRQFIRRNLERLVKTGLLTTSGDDQHGDPVYYYKPKPGERPAAHIRQALAVLKDKLAQHRKDLLISLGETEAYDEICADMPELQSVVQNPYNQARDRSVKLLGRIQAIETLITSQGAQ